MFCRNTKLLCISTTVLCLLFMLETGSVGKTINRLSEGASQTHLLKSDIFHAIIQNDNVFESSVSPIDGGHRDFNIDAS